VVRAAVAIMAKTPRAGEVKTRLCPPLSTEEAAELYRRFLLDKIEQVGMLRGAHPAIAYTPVEGRAVFEELAPGFALVPQQGVDLGARLANSFDRLFAEGYAAVLLIDSDTPTLPTGFLQRALDLIATPRVDVVLGPSEDGGYYLFGLRRYAPPLFAEIDWGGNNVMEMTYRQLAALGWRWNALDTLWDVDRPEDMEKLKTLWPDLVQEFYAKIA